MHIIAVLQRNLSMLNPILRLNAVFIPKDKDTKF